MSMVEMAVSRADILVLRLALHELRGSEVAVLADEAARMDAVLEMVQEQFGEEQR